MNRRQMLAATAALPAAALPLGGLAAAVNGTDAAWAALIAAEANHSAAVLALDDAETALWTVEPVPSPTAELPALPGIATPGQVTLAELRKARDMDPMFSPMSEGMEASFRRMLAEEAAIRPLRTPEAVAERRALYDRLEGELVEKGAVAEPVKSDHIARLESELQAASDGSGEADAALAAAPVVTFEDAARKLQHALHRMDGDGTTSQLVASALDGLRRLAGAA